jgi:hypothetical protein
MNCRPLLFASLFLLAVLVGSPAVGGAEAPLPQVVEFNRDIRPILADNCYACHGPDKNQRKAGLRLDSEESALGNRDGSPIIIKGKPEQSEIIRRLTSSDPKEHMPPARFVKKPTARQIALIRRWIEQGAKWQKHWSLLVPVKAAPPTVDTKLGPRNAIDQFILARLEQEGLRPSAEADRRMLIRRLAIDLTGLPPAPEQVEAFVADQAPDAYEKVVEQFLASKPYGERMALYWLDLVRYADTGGYHSDNHRDIAPYRDYVINAFNDNKPFDRFTIEQLAGDLLPNATVETRIASGYNRLLMTTEEGGAQAKEYMAKYSADRVRNVSGVWLGLTMGCAECHDHKFDPVFTKEFYRFAAFFADVKEKAVGRQDQDKLPTPEQAKQLKALDDQIAGLQKALAALKPPEQEPLKKQVADLQRQKQEIEKHVSMTLVTTAVAPRTMRVLPRGNWLDDSGEIVMPGVPASLPPLSVKDQRANRLDLARWMTAPENPLVARVFVNRVWKLLFGQGLVRTLDDFGSQGQSPSHPELLDWLAVEFRDGGWDVKKLVRLMVLSRTYRQSSLAGEELRQRDPYNVLLARQARYRLDAEMVRDNALAVSGLLVRKIGGPSVKPYQPAGYWAMLNFPTREWQNDQGEGLYRRGLYTYWCRTFPYPSLVAFDAPSREECTVDRPHSNTPLQALVLLNDPVYVESARAFAERILREGKGDVQERLHFAFRQAVNRQALPAEVKLLEALHRKHLEQYKADRPAAEALLKVGARPMPKDLDAAELAAWTSVTRVLLNLHETITRN